MFRTPSSVTPASLTPPTPSVPLTRTAKILRNAMWIGLLLLLSIGVALYFKYSPLIQPMTDGHP